MTAPPIPILIADDEAHIRHVVAGKLTAAGYDVRQARNGQEALDLVTGPAGFVPRLVITDFQMPMLSGLDLCKSLRGHAATATTPVLMLTARGYVLSEAELAKTNIRAVIAKPFGVRQLLERVQLLLAETPGEREAA